MPHRGSKLLAERERRQIEAEVLHCHIPTRPLLKMNEKVTESATKSPPASNAKDNQIPQSNSSELTSLGPDKVHTLTARATSTTVSKGTLRRESCLKAV